MKDTLIALRISKETNEALIKKAKSEGTNKSAIIRQAIQEKIK